ncbi:DUF3422 domain-containing protein [Aliishimia ponticola]|uniref:DUF3422 domain-containing protein n=1 Tax=Aliishimia ponticola TaxID=2499833 RepID=A0A4S4NH68_9RHOB|nr:DUF3422 domain-containing protein [Aliishimia ponticola]THH39016.1 DUF3422 domain-containing protein [Aliishimia ponticola]
MPPIDDHPLRYTLANELHARPFPAMEAPHVAAYLAIKNPGEAAERDRAVDLAHLVKLLDRFGLPHPPPGATHYYGKLGKHWLKWEQHTEFVTYTAFTEGLPDRVFDGSEFDVFPADWLAEMPGQRVTSVLVRVEPMPTADRIRDSLRDWFVPESLAVARVLDDAAIVAGDFRVDSSGNMRFAVFVDPPTGARRIGRIVQRLCEIETYKSMSMLGFSRVRSISGQLNDLDARLTALMGQMMHADEPAEETLHKLLSISGELEKLSAQCAFRFGATGAYEAIVAQRITALRETRYEGRQTFAEFMMRRYEPAMRTVKSSERRLEAMADRSIRAGNLLRTRVDVDRSAQNQALLESMDKRSDLQLRLQRTVEGLSVVAISYYAVSLASYLMYPLQDATGLSKGMLTAIITLPVVGVVWLMIRRLTRKLH